jgi:histidinol-phosphatase (PHP family)
MDFIKASIKDCFGGDPYAYCEAYYKNVAKIYEDTRCDIIGHFDLITKYIETDPLFSETDTRYIKARNEALEALLCTPAVFEVNTGAISRGYRTTPYPNPRVLERIKAAGKPIVVNSDSHKADTVDFLVNENAERLTAEGFKCLSSLEEILSYSKR